MLIQNKKVSDIYTGCTIFSTREVNDNPVYTCFRVLEKIEPEVASEFITVRGYDVFGGAEKEESKLILKKDADIVLAYDARVLGVSCIFAGIFLGIAGTLAGYLAITKFLF